MMRFTSQTQHQQPISRNIRPSGGSIAWTAAASLAALFLAGLAVAAPAPAKAAAQPAKAAAKPAQAAAPHKKTAEAPAKPVAAAASDAQPASADAPANPATTQPAA